MADTPTLPAAPSDFANNVKAAEPVPEDSASQRSETAHDFIASQLQLEADAREALPYSFSHCTQPLGPLKQNLYSCLTCSPPDSLSFQPAAVCYSCSIACHGEHTLVELFSRRNFTCDCGTTRIPDECPCTLRIDPATGMKGPVRGEKANENNAYNQNCKNRFCGCGEVYDAHQEKGTMFQCLGLAQEKDGGCGEDWWHPGCIVGLGREKWAARQPRKETEANGNNDSEEAPLPPGFPREDDFDAFICYKCADANPWIKQYAGTAGFLPAVYYQPPSVQNGQSESAPSSSSATSGTKLESSTSSSATAALPKVEMPATAASTSSLKKRTATDADLDNNEDDTGSCVSIKTPKISTDETDNTITSASISTATTTTTTTKPPAYHTTLPSAPPHPSHLSLFLLSDFRTHLCRCPTCYPLLSQHRHLLEEEDLYEPPLSSSSASSHSAAGAPGGSTTQRSLLDRGEAALVSTVDRVRAIEGVMVYNHLRDKVKDFLQPFAESGQAVGAEDVKAYFERLRGDESAIQEAAGRPQGDTGGGGKGGDGDGDGGGQKDQRREQGGY